MNARTASHGPSLSHRFAEMFPGERLTKVSRAEQMAQIFDRLEHQRPATCGAYALSYLFPALGFHVHAGNELTAEDYLAHLAGVTVEQNEIVASDEISRRVGAGELSAGDALQTTGRTWYRYPVRASADPVQAGTSPSGVARAISLGSEGRLATIPVPGRRTDDSVHLTDDTWSELLDLLTRRTQTWGWHAILNYETDQLLGPSDPTYTLPNLRSALPESVIARDTWGVGHFTSAIGIWRRRGEVRPWWLLLLDTYKDRGFDGYQPQPAELVRRGLVRFDGRRGGLLIVMPRNLVDSAWSEVEQLGIEPMMWSNGSPEPGGWNWARGE